MNNQNEISIALRAAEQPIMVESAPQLAQAVEDFMTCAVIGIDTEFVRERTWRADLGLVQLSDGERVWLVDPLACGPLDPLSALFENPEIIKVLHAPSEDLDVLLYTTGAVPDPLFDTQIACAMLGHSLQMGYHKTVEWLLDIAIDKGETRSNWCHRPLRQAQIRYAALDVCLLPMMQRLLLERLKDVDRESWLNEDCARLLDKARTPADPEQSWKRLYGNGRFDGTSLAILKSLASWRDREAEKQNLARGFVIKDNDLLTIANKKPKNLEALSGLNIAYPKTVERHGPALIANIEQVLLQGRTATGPDTLKPEHRKLMSDMRHLVQQRAAELSVDPALLASRRELESLILLPEGEPLSERYLGWRRDIVTTDLIALKEAFA
ncbi:MAG: ribonuclease D [Lysobacterales bacterium]